MNTPDIFEYNDFRSFLADYQKARQAVDRKFTKSVLSKLLGLPNTRSYFTDILKGKKLSDAFLERFIHIMDLSKEQAHYFRVLRLFNQAENSEQRELYFNQLIALNKTPKKVLGKELYSYYSTWYHSVIRALLNVYDFTDDYTELSRKVFPHITVREARQSVALLLKLGLIKLNSQGILKPTDKSIAASNEIHKELIKNYQLACFDQAKLVMVRNKSLPQNVSTNVISVSAPCYSQLEDKIAQFRNEVRSIIQKDEQHAERVYQLTISLIPNSK